LTHNNEKLHPAADLLPSRAGWTGSRAVRHPERTGTRRGTGGGTPITGCAAQPLNSSGQATCQVTYTATGSHAITAAYSGDTAYARSTSAPLTQQVVPDKADPTVKLSLPAKAGDGASVTETVTITNQGPATASKVVTALTEPGGLTVTNSGGASVKGPLLTWTTASPWDPGERRVASLSYPATWRFSVASIASRRVAPQWAE
jgi:hypothetical protein